MAANWFPVGRNNSDGWRLDIVSLLAVIGESSMESHSQALTSSWTCILPRIIPAPQALLKPSRPTRLPQVNAAVVGVHNGTMVQSLNYFPNIIHPIEDLPALGFKVLKISHRDKKVLPPSVTSGNGRSKEAESTATSLELGNIENGPNSGSPRLPARVSTFRSISKMITMQNNSKPRIPPQQLSPLNMLSVASCALTMGLIIWAALIRDGTAMVSLAAISLVSSVVGYASWWQPVLMKRNFKSKVPDGDVIIRTREGAFLLVRCDEEVARELYTGTEECNYYAPTQLYRILVAIGTFLLMVSVVLLGNCNFAMQAAIGTSYIVLNGAFWAASLLDKGKFWDLSTYQCDDITPKDAKNAHVNTPHDPSPEGQASFTRTMWYAIRETKKIGWVKRGKVAPETTEWDRWLAMAETNALANKRDWKAVEKREEVVCLSVTDAEAINKDIAEQHVPAYEVPPPDTR